MVVEVVAVVVDGEDEVVAVVDAVVAEVAEEEA